MKEYFESVISISHNAKKLTDFLNDTIDGLCRRRKCNLTIISGGIKDFPGWILSYFQIKNSCCLWAASAFLKYANQSQETLDMYAQHQSEGLMPAKAFLKIK